MKRAYILFVLVISPVSAGCVDLSDPDGEVGERDKISFNGLVVDADALGRLGTARLTTGSLADVSLPLNPAVSNGAERTDDGRHLLEYVARCALPADTELVVDGGAIYPGLFGLAPQWAEQTCDDSCQAWITACLLAHANMTGASVAISLRGNHPALEPTQLGLDEFTRQESAFYGNLFGIDGDDTPQLFGCMGQSFLNIDPFNPLDLIKGEEYLRSRICGTGACEFENTGMCYLPVAGVGACAINAGTDGYTACTDASLSGHVYSEVITVYLAAL